MNLAGGAKLGYFSANATSNLNRQRLFWRDAESRNRLETGRLHVATTAAELAGKLPANKREAIPLRTAMLQVEAVLKMLRPNFSLWAISAKRRNPWFSAGRSIGARWTGRGRPQPHDGARGCGGTPP